MAGIKKFINSIINNKNLRRPVVAKSLVATIFGDVIEPYGGRIWLGDLIDLVKLFGINERLLRTSIFRLAEEGWLKKTRKGRRSVYELSLDGREQTALAHNLIYRIEQKQWNGIWNIVIASGQDINAPRLTQLQHRLSLMGFGMLSKNIFAHPDTDSGLINKIITELGLQDRVQVMQSRTAVTGKGASCFESDRELVKQCCPYDEVDVLYKNFISAYIPVLKELKKTRSIRDDSSFKLRVLLIHDYRRLLFRDPQLPAELLPPDWSGKNAREIVRALYLRTCKQANRYYLEVCKADEIRPKLKKEFFTRFGGLDNT